MKFVKTLILMIVCLAIGAAGGLYEGFHYGVKSEQAKRDFATVQTAKPVALSETTPAPAPAAAPEAPAPAAAPAEPAKTAEPAKPAPGGWEQVGVKTMSQQAVIDLPEEPKAATPAPAAAAPEAAPTAAPAAGATAYEISPDDSALNFTGYKEVAGVKAGMNGFFGVFSGTVNVPGDNVEQMSFEVDVKTDSINTENAILTTVLKTGAFFDTGTYPDSKLVSKKIVKDGDKYIATVAWTMRDKTVGYELPLTIKKSGNDIEASCEVFIDRNQWGVGPAVYENKELGISTPILPEVKVAFDIVATKK